MGAALHAGRTGGGWCHDGVAAGRRHTDSRGCSSSGRGANRGCGGRGVARARAAHGMHVRAARGQHAPRHPAAAASCDPSLKNKNNNEAAVCSLQPGGAARRRRPPCAADGGGGRRLAEEAQPAQTFYSSSPQDAHSAGTGWTGGGRQSSAARGTRVALTVFVSAAHSLGRVHRHAGRGREVVHPAAQLSRRGDCRIRVASAPRMRRCRGCRRRAQHTLTALAATTRAQGDAVRPPLMA